MQKESVKTSNIQIIAITFSIISAYISLFLTYNQKLEIQNKKTFINQKHAYRFNLFNRTLIFLIALTFLYVNYKELKLAKLRKDNLKNFKLQINSSILTSIAAIITLYVVFNSKKEDIVDIENPLT